MALEQVGQCIFCAIDGTPKVYIHKTLYYREVQIFEHSPHRDAGIIYQNIYAAKGLHCLLYKVAAILLLADICGNGDKALPL